MLPEHVRPLFWDTKVDDFDPSAFPGYTIERVLEHGDEADVAWLVRVFTVDRIRGVLRSSSRLSSRSAKFWALVFGVSTSEVVVLQDSGHPFIRNVQCEP